MIADLFRNEHVKIVAIQILKNGLYQAAISDDKGSFLSWGCSPGVALEGAYAKLFKRGRWPATRRETRNS